MAEKGKNKLRNNWIGKRSTPRWDEHVRIMSDTRMIKRVYQSSEAEVPETGRLPRHGKIKEWNRRII